MTPILLGKGFVDSGGERIYYETAGREGASPTVVLSHGAGGNHALWFQQVPVLTEAGYRVITWDQRGFGRSTNTTEQPGPVTAVDDLDAVLATVEPGDEPVHLVAQSMGGWATVGFALRRPERVRSMVLADTIGGIYTPVVEEAFDAFMHAAAARFGEPTVLGGHFAVDDGLDPTLGYLYQQLGSFVDPPLLAAGPMLRTTSFPHEALTTLSMPVLCVVGSNDPIFPPEAIRSAAAVLPNATVVEIPGAAHSPYFEAAPAWNDAVLAFLLASS